MIGMNYSLIQKYFENNTALISMNKIDEFFKKIPINDRMMVETFMRTELDINVFDYIHTIPEGMFAYSDLGVIQVPETIKVIEPRAFLGCAAKSIDIKAQIIAIEEGTFEDCKMLQNVTLPEGLIKIDRAAFKNCSSLREVDLPNTTEKLEPGIFVGCSNNIKIKLPKAQVAAGKFSMPTAGQEGEFYKTHFEWK